MTEEDIKNESVIINTDEKNISVVMVSYNTGAILARAIDSVFAQEGLYGGLKELVLVNNGNDEKTLARLKKLATEEPRLKLLNGHGNIGFAAGCNLGAKTATGEYLLLLNPDCILSSSAISDTIDEMEKYPESWLAGCRMVGPDGKLQVGSKRNTLTPFIALTQAFRLNGLFNSGLNLKEDEDDIESSFVPAISGAFMMMRHAKYIEIGGMDEEYFFHVEDLDFCLTINKSGGKILYVPSVNVIHYRGSSRVTTLFVEKHKTDGFISYFKKHKKDLCPFGIFYLVTAGIYLRLFFRTITLGFGKKKEEKLARIKDEIIERKLKLIEKPIGDDGYTHSASPDAYYTLEPMLLTGATGQVGLNILRHLLDNNISTHALFNKQILDFRHTHLTWLQGDLSNKNWDIKTNFPKTLIHTPEIWLLPPHIEKFAGMGITRLICFSSTSIEGKSNTNNAYEQKMLKKFITAEKEIAERCMAFGIRWTILRPTLIYGCGMDKNITSIAGFIKRHGFFPISIPGTGYRQPVHVDDLAAAVIAILNNEDTYGKIYNLCGGSKITYLDMVRKIFYVMERKNKVSHIPFLPLLLNIFSLFTGSKEINGEIARRMNVDLVFDDSAAKKDFGYNAREFLDGGIDDIGV